ncbi:MAG: purine-binding chemotaxis protein CheW [Firmicutes bacterium]|nr:purine-binding chemotaxis protein CheW [Bacillota bacterium]
MDAIVKNKNDAETQIVAFKLEEEEFAINIHHVREVLKMTQVTPLPQSAYFIEGVINLRGEVMPVIDLRKRFELDVGERGEDTRIIIVEIQENKVGLIVDSVTEVLRLSSTEIQPPPSKIAGTRTDFIKGVGKIDDRLLIILDMDKILTTEEVISMEEITLSEQEKIGTQT